MRRRRRKNSIIQWVAAALVLAAAVWLLIANVVFVVREVDVEGEGEVPEADVRRLSGIHLGTRMLDLNVARVRESVESDGRLAFVALDRQFPSRVLLTVRPRTWDALILQGGKILVLDSDAYVVQVADQLPATHVPYVSGIKAMYYSPGRQLDTSDGRCPAMSAVLKALKEQGATSYVSELSVSNTDDLRIYTSSGMTVLLGNAENMEAKVAWMTAALTDLQARGQTRGTLDVSSATKADFMPEATQAPEASEGAAAVETQPQSEPTSAPQGAAADF